MKKVLLIEDDLWLGESYEKELRRIAEVCRVRNAEDAMRSIDDMRPDVIVADMMLDGLNSLTLFHELQTYDDLRTIPVVLCSGLPGISDMAEQLRPYGVVKVLNKVTVTSRDIASSVQEIFSERTP